MTDTTYSESYFSEKDFEQVVSACKFAFDELNMYIFDEGYMNDKYYIVGDETLIDQIVRLLRIF